MDTAGIINIIKAISRKKYKRKKEFLPFRKYNYIECGIILLFAVNFTVLVEKAYSYITWSAIQWQVVITGILAVLILAYVFLLIGKFKKIHCSKSKRLNKQYSYNISLIGLFSIAYI